MTRSKRLAAGVLAALLVLTGCSRVVDGQVSTQIEGLSTDITCKEFTGLSENDRLKVIMQILDDTPQSGSAAQRSFVMVTLAGVLCQGMPDMKLKALLGRMRVR